MYLLFVVALVVRTASPRTSVRPLPDEQGDDDDEDEDGGASDEVGDDGEEEGEGEEGDRVVAGSQDAAQAAPADAAHDQEGEDEVDADDSGKVLSYDM